MSPRLLKFLFAALLCGGLAAPVFGAEGGGDGFVPPIWAVIPFLGILLSIALLPLLAAHFWEHHYGKVSAFWMVLAVALMFFTVPEEQSFVGAYGHEFFKTYEEYLSFIILLGSL